LSTLDEERERLFDEVWFAPKAASKLWEATERFTDEVWFAVIPVLRATNAASTLLDRVAKLRNPRVLLPSDV